MFQGVAIGGHKAAGKDAALDYITKTRSGFELVRAKTPIVEGFEKYSGKKYDKTRDDAALIQYSATIARKENPNIVKEYLLEVIPQVIARGKIPILPDMRFFEENEACYDLTKMLCIKIEASPETCQARIIRRDGDLRNVVKNDPCEVACDDLKYHYVVDNDRDDDFKFAATQLEDYLRRAGANFDQDRNRMFKFGQEVRVINGDSGYYWDTGIVETMNSQAGTVGVQFFFPADIEDEPVIRHFRPYELMVV